MRLSQFLVILGFLALAGCDSGGGTSSGTSGGPGHLTTPLEGWWHGSWSRNTTLTDILVDTSDATTHLDPQDGVARLQITSASGSSQTISGSLLMSGFECFSDGTASGSWSGSNVGLTVTDSGTPAGAPSAMRLTYTPHDGQKPSDLSLLRSGSLPSQAAPHRLEEVRR